MCHDIQKFREILVKSKYVIITPDGVGSKGDEAMISGCLNLLRGERALLITPNRKLWKDRLLGHTHLFEEEYVPLSLMPELFVTPKQLIVIGADTLDGSCGYDSAHWRLETIKAVVRSGGSATVFCSLRSDMEFSLQKEWAEVPEAARVLVRDNISATNYLKITGRNAGHFCDLAFFSNPKNTLRITEYMSTLKEQVGQRKIIGLEISETMFRSFSTEISDEKRLQFAYRIAALTAQGLKSNNAVILLLTHDTRSWSDHWSDYQYACAARERIEGVEGLECFVQPPDLTQPELLVLLSMCNVVVCGRMHMSITSYWADCVPLLLAGTGKNYVMIDKVRGMCNEYFGEDSNLLLNPEEIPLMRDRVIEKRYLRATLNMQKHKLLEQMQKNKEELTNWINLSPKEITATQAMEEGLTKALNRSFTLNGKVMVLQDELQDQNINIERLTTSEQLLRSQIEKQKHELTEKTQEMERLLTKLDASIVDEYQRSQQIQILGEEVKALNCQVVWLSSRSSVLDAVYASRTWRYSHKLATMARRVCPAGSLRARVAGAIVRVPLRFEHWVRSLPAKRRAKKEQKYYFERLAPITLPQSEEPLVSIVIPVYNQFPFTYNCLRTIAAECAGMEYEVILADDNSTDETCRITEKVSGLIISRNAENQRFLRNCNNAAQLARGKYVMFLNNDTEVQPEWLQSLCETIEADDSIGMVGSKLIYANGQLQEAGGILWADGSAWNYGHGDDPEKSEYNYVKEVDYISGCSMMIRRSLWEEIGGFDERFVPAYCEDSDLAFEVRAHGYKVIYQPKSVVIHHEGISNGTDTSCGQKQYQIVNAKKFYEKWQSVLEDDQFEHAKNVFCARDRSCGKPCVLFIDHYTPTYDQDAGSRTVFEYLRLFVQMGYNVKFIPDNFYRMPKYCEALQQLGIEVLYGPEYAQHWKEWIIENKEAIKFVFTNRPHISIKYMDFLREKTNAKIAYYGHDLHFLRELREYELTGDKTKLESSSKWKAIEFALMRKADVAYYPSKIEQDIIHESDPSINVKVLVPYIFSEVTTPDYVLEEREDIMFLGGFNHGPNVDAALWFAKEILPLVQEKLPKVRWHVLGSHPPKEVQALASDTIKVHGFVTDEELAEFYEDCRMSVVPLRYGAGIKGKVVEAMKFGIPVLTTSVGAEGILGAENSLAVEDDPQAFADRLCSLYEDESALRAMSAASCEYIRTQYGPENAMNLIKEDFT